MRPLAALTALSLAVQTAAQQVALQGQGSGQHGHAPTSGSSQTVEASAETLVSALSASDQHSTFLRLLQRSKCIPMLSHIGSATLFAPTNDAWEEWFKQHTPDGSDELYQGWLSHEGLDAWLQDEDEILSMRISRGGIEQDEVRKMDNQNWALRQHLLYHMLNYTLPASAFLADESVNVTTETTLLFPLAEEPQLPPTPEPGSPWLPQGGEGMLGGHGQRLRVARAGSDEGGKRGRIGVDFDGSGGVEIWEGKVWRTPKGNDTDGSVRNKKDRVHGAKWVRNGVVVGVTGVIEPPPSIESVINSHPSLSYLSKLLEASSPLPSPVPENLSSSPHLTIFAPENQAFHGTFDKVERGYLEGGFGAEGVGRIFSGGVILGIGKGDQVGWRDTWGKKEHDIASASGLDLVVQAPEGGGLIVNGTNATVVDIFASNGVIHIVPDLLLPENFTLLNTVEKVLLSVNATRFVSLLRSANLSSTYVGQPGTDPEAEQPWTILAPTDDVFDMMDRWGSHGIPLPPSWQSLATMEDANTLAAEQVQDCSPLGSLLQYHILPGRLTTNEIKDGMLVGTEMRTSALKGARQRLRIDVSETFDQSRSRNFGQGEIRFGGATVLGPPVKSGKSIIYLLSAVLSPPDDALQTAVSDLQLSTFIAAVYAADLDKSFKKAPGVSYFVPRNRAFAQLGLGMQYLLSSEGKDELRKVVRYHALDEIIYADDIETGRTNYKTLEGGKVVLHRTKGDENTTLTLSSPSKWEGYDSGASFPSNGELRPARVWHTDALTETGVVHTIDSVMIPADVRFTLGKLIRGAKQATFADLMIRAGLEWILQGREPTSDEVARAQLQGVVRSANVDEEQPPTDPESLAMPSYTVLVPTDKAFSRLNLTQYLSDRDALLELLKLHIIPTQSNIPRTAKTKQPAVPPRDGQPLSLADDLVYQTLLSSKSKYGDVAFRATGDNSFMVGIRGARGNLGHTSARLGTSGRASVRWNKASGRLSSSSNDEDDSDEKKKKKKDDMNLELWKGGMTLGGGVFIIDSVLVPFQPNWFDRWGWVVIALVGIGLVLIIGGATFTWWWLARGKEEDYEPLEGEEED